MVMGPEIYQYTNRVLGFVYLEKTPFQILTADSRKNQGFYGNQQAVAQKWECLGLGVCFYCCLTLNQGLSKFVTIDNNRKQIPSYVTCAWNKFKKKRLTSLFLAASCSEKL